MENKNTTKKFFSEPKISFGMFFGFMFLVAVAVWYGAVKGNQVRISNIQDKHYIGEVVNTPDISLQVESVRVDKIGQPPIVPLPGYKFVIATVSLQNNGDKPFDLIPLLYFYLKDKDGNVFDVVAVPSPTNSLSGPILPHDKIREEIGFQVLENATDLRLYFNSGLPSNNVVAVDLVNKK